MDIAVRDDVLVLPSQKVPIIVVRIVLWVSLLINAFL